MRKKINYTEKNWQNLEAGKSEMKKKKKIKLPASN